MVKKGQLMNGRIKEMANYLLGRWASTEPAPQLESKRVSACRLFWYLLTAVRLSSEGRRL